MATVDVSITRAIKTNANFQAVWALLADTRATVSHYPKLDELVELGDNCWRWELQAVGIKGVSHQLIYSVRYAFDSDAGQISWTPLDAPNDNARVHGKFEITDQDQAIKIVLSTDACINLPAPRLLAGAIKPLVEREFQQQVTDFSVNLETALAT